MNRVSVFLLVLSAALLVVGAAPLFGMIPQLQRNDSSRPPCEQLPDRQTIVDAISAHEELLMRIQDVGPGVTVDVETPCESRPDRAIVSVKYSTRAEQTDVDAILRHEGFGVAAELVRR